MRKSLVAAIPAAALGAVAAHDLAQKRHAILRNFPVVGHARFWLERIGPELRQYIVAGNDEERPFSRDQRRWVYASAKLQNNYFGFGTDNDLEHSDGNVIVHHRTFGRAYPTHGAVGQEARLPGAKVLGGPRGRRHAFRPESVVNISGMSFGSLSGNAIEAINRGAAAAGCLHNTGEGAISPYHRQGADLVFQIGTAYFGCRDDDGRFSLPRLKDLVAEAPVRALEIKLSQGAKPGLGGVLPGPKVSREIAETRGVPEGVDCLSPSRHAEFDDVDSLLDFVELLADETGLPVGIKSAVGDLGFWEDLAEAMARGDRGVDFVTIDGGEGGTGASPLIFTDAVSLPFRLGFARAYAEFARRGLHEDVTFIGSGKLGLPDNAVVAFALGADLVNVAREAMLAVGCVQAQQCHTGECPTGVATQNPWLAHGLDPVLKGERVANYVKTLRRDLLKVSETCGVEHPALIGPDSVEVLDNLADGRLLHEIYGYEPGWGYPSEADRAEIAAIMAATDEEETRTEGPPETAEEGEPGDQHAGEGGTESVDV
ncbi:FMN-binding glutamate synthase family protein [Nocardioides sp. MAH-18]|uniref:FMN-binding glutamate synthase family protein n=1 Tax=Nocardioides agri TaxID=2682843 RepID=A0A6L6XUK8_9ACTN|nr:MULTISPECIES: FMN-binding glutamate synthase family protein [unclassified Nocardioides]MBA2955315.1 FMN-binding glutamate synthase family protein [Nocardioides sp. CGMCC 1.13656]MVQ50166.1 FMN-binding glutamate synthase family protein [Nocardioides sp. MAH-18]